MANIISLLKRGLKLIFWEHLGVTAVLVISLITRLVILEWWNTFPYGDVFNFVNVAREIGHGNYPADEKRLPFYPLLILIVHTVLPQARWEHAAIGIAIAASLATLALLYAIGRQLHLRKTALIVGLLLCTSFQPFLHYSIRGYADTTAIALLLAGILTVLRIRQRRAQILLSFLLGALALTRYEGAAASVTLFIIALIRLYPRWRQITVITVLLIISLLPYVWIAQRSDRSLLPTAYLEEAAKDGPEGYGAFTLHDWWEKYVGIWQRLGVLSVWYVPRNFYQTVRDDFIGFHHQLVETFAEPRSATGVLATVGFIFLLLRRRFRDFLTITLPFAVAAVPVAWYAPYTRYDALIFPIMALGAAAAVHLVATAIMRATHEDETWGRWVRYGAATTLLVFAACVWMIRGTQEAVNMLKKNQFLSLSYYQALLQAENLPGTIAIGEANNYTMIYFGDRAVYAARIFQDLTDADARWQALQENQVTHVVDRHSDASPFAFLQTKPFNKRAEKIADYEYTQGDGDITRTAIYRLKFE